MSEFSQETINKVWKKAKIQTDVQEDKWRKDYAGAWIKKSEYGNVDSDYGWEIDHAKPVSQGGSDNLGNLRPLHWQNNRTKGNDYPKFKTSISSDGNKNVEKEQNWEYKS